MTYLKLAIITVLAVVIDCLLSFAVLYVLASYGIITGDGAPYFIFLVGCGLLPLIFYFYRKGLILDFNAVGIVYRPSKRFYIRFWFLLAFVLMIIGMSLYAIVYV